MRSLEELSLILSNVRASSVFLSCQKGSKSADAATTVRTNPALADKLVLLIRKLGR